MLLIKIETPSWRRDLFNEEANEIGLKCATDLIDGLRESTHIREFIAKHKAAKEMH